MRSGDSGLRVCTECGATYSLSGELDCDCADEPVPAEAEPTPPPQLVGVIDLLRDVPW